MSPELSRLYECMRALSDVLEELHEAIDDVVAMRRATALLPPRVTLVDRLVHWLKRDGRGVHRERLITHQYSPELHMK